MEIDIDNIAGTTTQVEAMGVTTEKKQYNNSNWKNNNNWKKGNNNSNRVSLWDDVNIEPMKFEFLKLNYTPSIKTFSLFYNARRADSIDNKTFDMFKKLIGVMIGKGYKFRSWLDTSDKAKIIAEGFKDKPEAVDHYLLTRKTNPDIQVPVSLTNKKLGFQLAKGFLKNYATLPGVIRAITSRDIEVLLGGDFNTPLNCLFIYTTNGDERITQHYKSLEEDGNIFTIIRMATELRIPIFNINTSSFTERLKIFLETGKYVSHYAFEQKSGKYDNKMPAIEKPEVLTNLPGEEESEASVKKLVKDETIPMAVVEQAKEAKVEEEHKVEVQPETKVEVKNEPVVDTNNLTEVIGDLGI